MHDLWKFSMDFLKSINIKKLKGMMCMSSANTQNRFKKPLWAEILIFFSSLSYKRSPEADRAASASLPNPIWKLMFVVLLGNLALTCNFFQIHHLLFTSVEDVGGLTSHRRWSCLAWRDCKFSPVWNWQISHKLQILIGQEVSWWNYFWAERSCRNDKGLKQET